MTNKDDFISGFEKEKKDIVKPTANLAGRNCDRLDNADDTKLIILLDSVTIQQ